MLLAYVAYDDIFDSVALVSWIRLWLQLFSHTDVYSSRCFNLLNNKTFQVSHLLAAAVSPKQNCECRHNVHFYWLYNSPVIPLSSFLLDIYCYFYLFALFLFIVIIFVYFLIFYLLLLFFFFSLIYCYFLFIYIFVLIIYCYFVLSLFLLLSLFIIILFISFLCCLFFVKY